MCQNHAGWFLMTHGARASADLVLNKQFSGLTMQIINSLDPDDATYHETWLTLAQVMVSWQMVPNHHLNQCCMTNTLRPRQNGPISQTTFSNAFSRMKVFKFLLKFH